MASLRSLILAVLLALLCSFHTPLAPTAKAQDLPFRSEQEKERETVIMGGGFGDRGARETDRGRGAGGPPPKFIT